MSRRLGPDDPRELRQPLSGRGGLVVHDVVDGGAVVLEREHGRRGGVVEVDEDQTPAPSPAIGNLRARTASTSPSSGSP